MLFDWWNKAPKSPARPRLAIAEMPGVVYAVGDVHGCLNQLKDLLALIADDAAGRTGDKLLVFLGDYIDRGPQSAGVLDLLTARAPQGFHRVTLAGNHEVMAAQFIANPSDAVRWLEYGGNETLMSYNIDVWSFGRANTRERRMILQSHIPQDHIAFLNEAPVSLSVPGYAFVHAGIKPGVTLEKQSETDLLWMREPFLTQYSDVSTIVVHGHTPQEEPVATPARICIDTGAYATGRLTAVRLIPGEAPAFLSTSGAARRAPNALPS